jgi:hypothetical protein
LSSQVVCFLQSGHMIFVSFMIPDQGNHVAVFYATPSAWLTSHHFNT